MVSSVSGVERYRCTACGKLKPITEFYRNGKYVHHLCKPCYKLAVVERRKRRAGKLPPEQGEKYCSTCRRLLPITEFYVNRCYGRSQSSCKECTKKAAAAKKTELRRDPEYRRQENEKWMRRYNTNEEFKAKHNSKAAERKRKARAKAKAEATEQVCRNCWLYPCFRGIENMTTNFALTCRKWHLKGKG